jgi:hypothetical protein
LNIGDRAPEEALNPALISAGNLALGHLVVYRDGNHDGKLELRSGTESSPDRVLGASSYWRSSPFGPQSNTTSYEFFYADAPTAALAAGFTLLRIPVDANGQQSNSDDSAVPLDTQIEIVLDSRPVVATMNCGEICHQSPYTFPCPADPSDLPEGGDRSCNAGGDGAFVWRRLVCTGCVCEQQTCEYAPDPDTELPAEWPCQGTAADE